MQFLAGILLCGLVVGITCAATDSGAMDYILNELANLKNEVRENSELIQDLTKEREEDKTKITELTEQLRYKSEQFDNFRTEFELLKDLCQLVSANYSPNDIRKKPNSLSVQPTNNRGSLTDNPAGQNRPDNTTMVTDGRHAVDGNANDTAGDTSDAKRIHTSTRRGSKRLIADETPSHSQERVAFSAHNSLVVDDLGTEQVLPFDTVTANAGDAFDPVIHMFVCPVDGMYYFHSAVRCTYQQHIETEMVKDGVVVARLYAAATVDDSSHGFDQGANAVVTECNEGEHVWVRQKANQGTGIDYQSFTTFSGFLLFTL